MENEPETSGMACLAVLLFFIGCAACVGLLIVTATWIGQSVHFLSP
jgi:hypothetical protein